MASTNAQEAFSFEYEIVLNNYEKYLLRFSPFHLGHLMSFFKKKKIILYSNICFK